MAKIGDGIETLFHEMGAQSESARINMRAQQVRKRYKEALQSVYGANAQAFLAHTNNVYIMRKEGIPTLIVYVDDSIFASELNAQRELIRLKLLELFGEQVEEFEIYVSRGKYKDNHPYLEDEREENEEDDIEKSPSIPLDADERAFVDDTVSRVSDSKLAETIKKAMTADMEWKKGVRAAKMSREGKNGALTRSESR